MPRKKEVPQRRDEDERRSRSDTSKRSYLYERMKTQIRGILEDKLGTKQAEERNRNF